MMLRRLVLVSHVLFLSVVLASVSATAGDRQEQEPTTGKQSEKAPGNSAAAQPVEGKLQAGMGIMVGEVTDSSALVQVRLTTTDKLVDGDVPGAEGYVHFYLERADGRSVRDDKEVDRMYKAVAAKPKHDFIARARFTDLKPGVEYVCRTVLDKQASPYVHAVEGPKATFRTLPGKEKTTPVRFVVVTGMNYAKYHGDKRIDREQHVIENNTELPPPYAGKDKHLGYPALETIRKLQPDFFIGTGDNVYYDTPDKPRAKTTEELRRKWHEQFVQPRYRELFAVVPTYWEVDDHDYRMDDCDNTGDYDPSPEVAQKLMREQLPYGPLGEDVRTYRTHRVSKDLQIWLVENRIHRSPNKMPDGPQKTIWGEAQRAWLKRTLEESDATFKLLISPNPMIGPDDARKTDNHTNFGGFRHERDAFFHWLKETGLDEQNFYIVCGDRHWQYHSIHPAGIEEFSCGALVDANSRLGRPPGDPKSTDPDAKINQVYTQAKPSGGFLLIETQPAGDKRPATLNFRFHDERGKLLYQHAKRARG